ncbi:hypothetical protein GWN26_15025, partial [Candidatus Saccharibacteria bacterium]|nr:hypothetical protein [Candidatus Saccharibacteria bacterium]NIV04487.1 hypothetical protein [Calditrichia bacterium]NIS38616.1 hypothetical protein [Candidatus Saccharibacteria bacterium]NIV73081.1 hypothetical protein [Calditrichia bacterium]NIW00356.1 hypothetical protein [Candidatus Saccharibacteria bacterium]
MKATHKPKTVIIGNQAVILNPGQFLFGRKKASEDTCLSQQNVRTALKVLIAHHQITIKSTNKYSIISITNWHRYQPATTDNQPAKQPASQPTDNQQITTYKNNKNIKNINTSPADADIYNEIDALSEWLYDKNIFPKVHAFKNKMLKENKNPAALSHTLSQLR